MTPTKWKMQPTIHCCCKPRYSSRPYKVYFANVLWVAFSVGLIITRGISCMY
jgi:hypothetical protein